VLSPLVGSLPFDDIQLMGSTKPFDDLGLEVHQVEIRLARLEEFLLVPLRHIVVYVRLLLVLLVLRHVNVS
jgi:hypothetical protein